MGSRRAGRDFKRFLEAVGFILAEFELKRSHGDPIRDNFYGFWTRVGAAVSAREISVSERDISVLFYRVCVCVSVCGGGWWLLRCKGVIEPPLDHRQETRISELDS